MRHRFHASDWSDLFEKILDGAVKISVDSRYNAEFLFEYVNIDIHSGKRFLRSLPLRKFRGDEKVSIRTAAKIAQTPQVVIRNAIEAGVISADFVNLNLAKIELNELQKFSNEYFTTNEAIPCYGFSSQAFCKIARRAGLKPYPSSGIWRRPEVESAFGPQLFFR